MRIMSCLFVAFVASSPAMAQTMVPGSPLLRPDRIRPFTDTISLLLTPPDSAQRVAGTLIRRVELARTNGTDIFRETQHYVLASGGHEVDTLDVSVATLAPLRVVEINSKSSHDLRLDGGRLRGVEWSADSGRRTIDAPQAEPFFHGMMTEAFIAGFPFTQGSTLRLPVGETPHPTVRMAEFNVTGAATLRTAEGRVECLVVQESRTTVGWVSKADGHLVRLHWTLPNGTSIWKVSSHDVPFMDAGDLVTAGRLAAQAAHS